MLRRGPSSALGLRLTLLFVLFQDLLLQNMECLLDIFPMWTWKSMSLESWQSVDSHAYASSYSSLLFSHNWERQEMCLQDLYMFGARVWRFISRASLFAKLKSTRGWLTGCMQIFSSFLQSLKRRVVLQGEVAGGGGVQETGGAVCPAVVREMNYKMDTLPQRIPFSAQVCHLIKNSFLRTAFSFFITFLLIGHSFWAGIRTQQVEHDGQWLRGSIEKVSQALVIYMCSITYLFI